MYPPTLLRALVEVVRHTSIFRSLLRAIGMSNVTKKMVVELRKIASLHPRVRNARTHSKKQVRQVAKSIERFGFVNPILIDREGVIIAGHARLAAAKLLGLEEAPTLVVGHLSQSEIRALVIADNQLATLAGWDKDLLSPEIAELLEVAPEIDLTVVGFELNEIALLHDVSVSKGCAKPNDLIPELELKATTRLDDFWEIGSHRLFCGDALAQRSFHILLDGQLADLVITDPPFNVPISGHVSSARIDKFREFVAASGELTDEQFQRFLYGMCEQLVRHSRSGSLSFIFIDWRSLGVLLEAGNAYFDSLLNVICWAKSNPGMGSMYRSQHELVALFKHGKRQHINNIELGRHGRNRSNVWQYPSVDRSDGKPRPKREHPTIKNCQMIADAILDASDEGHLVLDPFGGSGTTLIAAARTRRKAALIELDPLYCDLIVRRAEAEGLTARLMSSGETLAEVAARRAGERQTEELLCSSDDEPVSAYDDLVSL